MAKVIEMILEQENDRFIIVQAAGNGWNNGGHILPSYYGGTGINTYNEGFFDSIDEYMFNLLDETVREKLEDRGITFSTIKNHIIVVGAVENTQVNGQYKLTTFSNYGNNVDICAPGKSIFSTLTLIDDSEKPKDMNNGNRYGESSGTSMAAPMVSAAAALVWQVNPDLSAAEVKDILISCNPNGAVGVTGEDAGRTYPMLNVGMAVEEAARRKTAKSDEDTQTQSLINYYEIFDVTAPSWQAAEEYCESLGGHLATITTPEENDHVYRLLTEAGYSSAYFGLTNSVEEGKWRWVTGEPVVYTNWHSSEPNRENSNEDYAMFYFKFNDGSWNDGDFGGRTVNGGTAFICEWDTYEAYEGYLIKHDTQLPSDTAESLSRFKTSTISACGEDSAVIKNDGSLWVWGDNPLNRTGYASEDTYSTPTKVLDDALSVFIGSLDSGVIKSDGSLWMWGNNSYGQVGNGGDGVLHKNGVAIIQTTPVKVLDDVLSVSIGSSHTAAIKNDHTLWIWGDQKATEFIESERILIPTKVMDDVVAVAVGQSHTAVVKQDGSLWAWGGNYFGQIGNGDHASGYDNNAQDTYQDTPVKIMENVVAVSAAWNATAAIDSDGSLWMWGCGEYGKLGTGTNDDVTLPTKVMENVAAVSMGDWHTVAVKTDGTLWAWGRGGYYALGNGNLNDAYAPIQIMEDVVAASAGDMHTIALKSDGTLWIWGTNYLDALGTNGQGNGIVHTSVAQTVPVKLLENIALPSAYVVFSSISPEQTELDSPASQKSEEELLSLVSSRAVGELKEYIYLDMDHDGTKELISVFNDQSFVLHIWYCNSDGSDCFLVHDMEELDYSSLDILEAISETHVALNTGTMMGNNRHYVIIRLENKFPILILDQYGYVEHFGSVRMTESGEIAHTFESYDGLYDPKLQGFIVHTWKDTFLFFDGNAYKEYGALQISEEVYLQFQNALTIKNLIIAETTKTNTEYLEFSYFLRANGILHIQCNNHASNGEIEYGYYTVRYNGAELDPNLGVYNWGQMSESMSAFEAVYPKYLPIDNNYKDDTTASVTEATAQQATERIYADTVTTDQSPFISASSGADSLVATGCVFPDSSNRYLTDDEIAGLTDGGGYTRSELIRFAINELYARNHMSFGAADLNALYSSQSWYANYGYTDRQAWENMNEIERYNLDNLIRARKAMQEAGTYYIGDTNHAIPSATVPISSAKSVYGQALLDGNSYSVEEKVHIIANAYYDRKNESNEYRDGYTSRSNSNNSTGYRLGFYYGDGLVFYAEVIEGSSILVKLYYWNGELIGCRDYRYDGNLYYKGSGVLEGVASEFYNVYEIGMNSL